MTYDERASELDIAAAKRGWRGAPTPPIRVGQIWRDLERYPYRVVAIDDEGKIWVRYAYSKTAPTHSVRRAWFDEWELYKDAAPMLEP